MCFLIIIYTSVMMRMAKYLKLVLHIGLINFIIFLTDIQIQPPIMQVKKLVRHLPDMKHFLLWSSLPGVENEGQKVLIEKSCFYINCYFTTNRSLLGDVRYFDAIIFNAKQVSEGFDDLPKARAETQKYIFAANDSSDNNPVCSSIYDSFFNWTWTYKLDSSIPYRFVNVHHIEGIERNTEDAWNQNMIPIDNHFKNVLSEKSKAAAIFLDKCKTNSKRELFLHNLQDELNTYNLSVDVYGKCGPKTCGRRSKMPCFNRLKTTYYFYLAFEDSIAEDYMTDEVMYGYENNAVPIVFGGNNYVRDLPPNSYLNAIELGEAQLAKTMHSLIHNKEKYYDFFRWRRYYMMKRSSVLDVCVLCNLMNNQLWLTHKMTYIDFRNWWNDSYKDKCGSKGYIFF